MSEVVHYKGKIELVKRAENETLAEQCKRILEEKNVDLSDINNIEDNEEIITDEFRNYFYEEYVIVDDNIYKILTLEQIDDYELFNVNHNEDGTYDYEVEYYNGGICLEDAIKYGFKLMKDNYKYKYVTFTTEILNLKPDDVVVIKYEPNIVDLNNLIKIEELLKNKIPNKVLAIPTSMKLEKWKECDE